MPEKVNTIAKELEALAPSSEAMSWDNVGLQVGSLNQDVNKALVCLDVNEMVLEEAIDEGIGLIITHHPLIFKPIKKIIDGDVKGSLITKAIKNNISIYVTHTNIDMVQGGLNDFIAHRLGLYNSSVLEVEKREGLNKLTVFVPKDHINEVAAAMGKAGAGHIGNYSHCSFRTEGIGTFMALEGSNPYIGRHNMLEMVEEIKLETIIEDKNIGKVINEMFLAHPYEEVAYDIYPLKNEGKPIGVGRVAELENPMLFSIFIEDVKENLKLEKVRVVGDINRYIQRVAVVNGSGGDYIKAANMAKCDCLITGDVKYHEAQMALEEGLNIIDIGHFESELPFVEMITEYLADVIEKKKYDIEVVPSKVYMNPFQYL